MSANAAKELIDSRVRPLGFVYEGLYVQTEEGYDEPQHDWTRVGAWKSERITLLIRSNAFRVNLAIELPASKSGVFAFANLETLADRGIGGYRFPSLFSSWRSVLKKLDEDLKKALTWFKGFESPQECLQWLLSGRDRNYVAGMPGSPKYKAFASYLESLLGHDDK